MASSLLTLESVESGYGELEILRGIDLRLEDGSITAVIGANGAGKSTLLKTVFGIVATRRGIIRYQGADITAQSPAERLRSGISYIPQGRSNFPEMKVHENLEMGAYIRQDGGVERDIQAIYNVFPILGERKSKRAGDLSGGEQQQLEMAMALMLAPKIALIDEPSLGLSATMQSVVFDAIKQLREQGTTVLMVEQNAVQALRIADKGIVIELGVVSVAGSGVEMLNDPEVRRAYLGLPTEDQAVRNAAPATGH